MQIIQRLHKVGVLLLDHGLELDLEIVEEVVDRVDRLPLDLRNLEVEVGAHLLDVVRQHVLFVFHLEHRLVELLEQIGDDFVLVVFHRAEAVQVVLDVLLLVDETLAANEDLLALLGGAEELDPLGVHRAGEVGEALEVDHAVHFICLFKFFF